MKLSKKRVNEAPVVDSGDMATDIEAVMRKYDRESATRIWEGWQKTVVQVLMAVFSLYCIGMTFLSVELPETKLARFLAIIIVLGFLTYPAKKGSLRVNYVPWYDIVLMVLGAGSFFYFAFNAMEIIKLATMIEVHHVVIGVIGVLVPGIIAQEMEKQGVLKSLLSLSVVVGLLVLVMLWQGMRVFPV